MNKSGWTLKEDLFILEKYKEIGSKWVVIAKMSDHRSENMVKNRFYKHISILYKNQLPQNIKNSSKTISCFSEEYLEGEANYNEINIINRQEGLILDSF